MASPLTTAGNVMVQKIRKGLLVSALVLWGVTTFLSSGCATSRGFGQDVESLGRDIQKNAK
jgi:predicted small secreted protein